MTTSEIGGDATASVCEAQLGFLTMQGDPSSDQVKTLEPQLHKSPSSDTNIAESIANYLAKYGDQIQIALHERVGEIVIEMKKMRLIDKEDEKTIYHRIHQRDPDIIKKIIEIRDDDEETSREQRLENIKKLKDALKKPSGAADVKPFLWPPYVFMGYFPARLPFKRTSRKRYAHILQVPTGVPGTGDEEDIFKIPLVRYFVENVWKLERPDVIISVTGGASLNFDLHPDKNDMLMRGMMEGTRKLKPWSVPIYGCISVLSVCGYCIVHACSVRVLRASLAHA